MKRLILGIAIGLLAGGIIVFIATSYVDLTSPFSWLVFFISAVIVGAAVEMIFGGDKRGKSASEPDSDTLS